MTTRTDRFQVVFEVDGDGKLKAALGDLGREGDKAAQGLDRASAAKERMQVAAVRAAAVLGGALVTGLGLVIKNTMEAERVNAQLEATLRTLGARAAATRDQIGTMVEELQRTTTFDDESLTQAADALLKFTNIDPRNFGAALEMATDLSAALGDDLVGAAERVGKALNSPETAMRQLRDMGVQLSDQQQETIKTLMEQGRVAEAQGLVLKELSERYGQAAEAGRQTFGGAIEALSHALMNLTEGRNGSLNGATQAVNDMTATMNDPDVKAGFNSIIEGLIGITNYSAKAVAGLGNATAALREFFSENSKKSTVSLENKRTDLETELFGEQRRQRRSWLGQAAAQNSPRIQEIKAEMAEIDRLLQQRRAQDIADASASGGGGKSGRFSADYEVASLNFNPNPKGKGGSGGGSDTGRARIALIDEEAAARKRLTQEIIGHIAQTEREIALMGIDHAHREELTAIYDVQYGKLRDATQAEKDAYVEKARALDLARETNLERERQNELMEREAQARQDAQESLDAILESQRFELSLLRMTNAERALANAERSAGARFSDAKRREFLTNQDAIAAAEELQGYANDTKEVLHGFFMDMSRDARGTFNNIGDYFDQLIDRILDRWLTSQIDSLFDGVGTGGGGGSGGGFWGSLAGLFGFGGGGSSASSASGGASFLDAFGASYANGGIHGPQGPIPLNAYASGGIAKRPQLALFGEGRMPEAYVPLPDGRTIPVTMSGAGGGGDTYVIHNNIRGDVTRASADQLAGKLAMKLQRQAARNR